MTGTVLNIITVLVGGSIGTLLGNRMPAKVQETVMHGLGLMVLVIGVVMASGTANLLIPLFSVVVGGVLGELMRISDGLDWLGCPGGGPLGHAAGAGQGRRLECNTRLRHLQPHILRRSDDSSGQHPGWPAGRLRPARRQERSGRFRSHPFRRQPGAGRSPQRWHGWPSCKAACPPRQWPSAAAWETSLARRPG